MVVHTQQSDDEIKEVETNVNPLQDPRDPTAVFDESDIVRRGGFGYSYKVKLHDGLEIAIKRMEPSVIGGKGLDDFKSEVSVLTKVHQSLKSSWVLPQRK